MNSLLINTANNELVIVLKKGEHIFSKRDDSQKRHNEVILPLIDTVLNEGNITLNDIDEMGVVVGPGSFTGIRVGIATVKAFKDVLGIPVKSINNLDILYEMAKKDKIGLVAINGSLDSYFVGKVINGEFYKYPRNLTLEELKTISAGEKIATYQFDENFNCVEYKILDEAFISAYQNSNSFDLTPVYYQLSQAENDKFNHSNLIIDEARLKDINDIVKIDNSLFDYLKWTEKSFMEELNSPNHTIFVARLDGNVIGFVDTTNCADEINITKIAVNKEFQNKGVGSKLISAVENLAKTMGVEVVSLDVSDKNITALNLYNKMGYLKRDIRKHYYQDGSNAIIMLKNV